MFAAEDSYALHAGCTTVVTTANRGCQVADHDVVIRGGVVVDGTGAPGRGADVAIDDGVITHVGEVRASGREEIDADGLLVTPGWVDVHTHYDGQVTWDPLLTPSSWQGVTTVVMGNCGVGFAPVRRDRHDFLIRLMEGVEDIPGTALHEGITWGWESFPEYLDVIDSTPHAIDFGAQVPHAALRAFVMGDRGADHAEVPTDSEIGDDGAARRRGDRSGRARLLDVADHRASLVGRQPHAEPHRDRRRAARHRARDRRDAAGCVRDHLRPHRPRRASSRSCARWPR